MPALSAIEATREGGEPAMYAAKLEKLIASSASGHALLLAAEYETRIVGLAKVTRFTP